MNKFTIEDINRLKTLSKKELLKLKAELGDLKDYYSSGHAHLYGVKTVQDNIVNLINMTTDLSFAKKLNVTVAGNGSTYDKSVEGVIPEAMTYLFNYRVELKTEMKEKNKLLQLKLAELQKYEN